MKSLTLRDRSLAVSFGGRKSIMVDLFGISYLCVCRRMDRYHTDKQSHQLQHWTAETFLGPTDEQSIERQVFYSSLRASFSRFRIYWDRNVLSGSKADITDLRNATSTYCLCIVVLCTDVTFQKWIVDAAIPICCVPSPRLAITSTGYLTIMSNSLVVHKSQSPTS